MSRALLVKVLGGYVVALLAVCLIVIQWASLHASSLRVESAWVKGELIAQRIGGLTPDDRAKAQAAAVEKDGVASFVTERAVGEGPVLAWSEATFALSVVPGMDGVHVVYKGKEAVVTPDELLSRQGYDHGINIPALTFSVGTDVPLVLAILSERLEIGVPDLRDHGSFTRFRVERIVEGAKPAPPPVLPETMTADDVRTSALAAAHYLARGVDENGKYRYLVNAPTNRTLGGYNWPRHAGATYFLAQAAALEKDPELAGAARRAAATLRDKAGQRCGDALCIGTGDTVDLGSSALALVAFAEIVRNGIDPSFASTARDVAKFVRNQQRPDGEFMHEYNRVERKPVDVQYLYYSGEATLGLARAYRLFHDAEDLDAAHRGLSRLVGTGWTFFGDRYYFGEEHWTCQAMADLWEAAPDPKALDFCVRWQAYGRHMMHGPGETPYDADGSYGVGPLVMPRLTPVASRAEAGVATLDAARRAGAAAGVSAEEMKLLAFQLRRSLALILRNQFTPGPAHLFADPAALEGAIPGSPVDWDIRIDYAQHAGSMMIRWLALHDTSAK